MTDLLRKEDLLDAELEQIKNTLDKEIAELEKLKTEYVMLYAFRYEITLFSVIKTNYIISYRWHLNVLCLIAKLLSEPSQIYPLKTSEKFWFSDIFRGYRYGAYSEFWICLWILPAYFSITAFSHFVKGPHIDLCYMQMLAVEDASCLLNIEVRRSN